MRWTDEVHVSRTLAARRDARQLSKGLEVNLKGHTGPLPLLVVGGSLAALAACEKRGSFRVRRLPFVGPWLSSNLHKLRCHLSAPRKLKVPGRLPPSEAARAAALKRQANAQGPSGQQSHALMQQQRQVSDNQKRSANNKKKGRGRRR